MFLSTVFYTQGEYIIVKVEGFRSKFLFLCYLSQCSPGGLYGGYNSQGLFPQQRIPPHSQDLQPKTFPKPIYSYRWAIISDIRA